MKAVLSALALGLMACGGIAASSEAPATDVASAAGPEGPVFCPGTAEFDEALLDSAERVGLDYTIDCAAPGAARVDFLGGGSCEPSSGDLCASRGPTEGAAAPLADRVELALRAWLGRRGITPS